MFKGHFYSHWNLLHTNEWMDELMVLFLCLVIYMNRPSWDYSVTFINNKIENLMCTQNNLTEYIALMPSVHPSDAFIKSSIFIYSALSFFYQHKIPHLLLLSNSSSMFMFQAGRKDRSDALNTAIDRMTKKTRDLRRQVCPPHLECFPLCLHLTHNLSVRGHCGH